MPQVSDDADNFHPLRLGCLKPDEDALAHCRLSRKSLLSERVIDHDQPAIGRVIGIREGPSGNQRRAHCLEISRRHDLKIRRLKLARIRERLFFAPPYRTIPTCQRKRKRAGDVLYSRDGTWPLLHLASECCIGRRRSGAVIAVEDKGEEVARIKAGIDTLQVEGLRNISPEPTNSTNESATSAVTTALRMPLPVPSPVLRLMPRSTFIRRGREARSAGVMPKRIAPASPASAVKASTDVSMVIVSRRGRSAGASERSSLIPAQASASPARVPTAASQMASAMIGDINFQRLAIAQRSTDEQKIGNVCTRDQQEEDD